jgi:hypothetical protein
MANVTIQSLEVRLNVEAESDDVVFARLFDKHSRELLRRTEEAKRRDKSGEKERALNQPGGHA